MLSSAEESVQEVVQTETAPVVMATEDLGGKSCSFVCLHDLYRSKKFYVPVSIDWGHIVIGLSIRASICLAVTKHKPCL